MLQQTQIPTVLGKGYFSRFLQAFPDLQALAEAEDEPLLKAWEGLGYYRRARMLRETARALLSSHSGIFPLETKELIRLPGIGPYTAGALRAFAFGLPAVLVDGNIARVVARLMDFKEPIDAPSGLKQLWAWAQDLSDPERARTYHAALMELGQTHCRPGVPDCLSCPVVTFCKTRTPESLPCKHRKTLITAVDEHSLWLRDGKDRLLLHLESGQRRTGLWKLPVREASEIGSLPVLLEHSYAITRYRVRLKVHEGSAAPNACVRELPGDRWIPVPEIPALAMAAPFRKVITQLLQDF